ncbi:hypothetical protein VL04_14735 [Chromobacterium violaceum]|nr:hypothetical protein VK93_04310 [Chromobacterium violaceum]KMN87121.1 hypothetical protein VL02_04665 [Chromobacterium violaceum]KMN89755.1 hypothetical protein VL04_14735 [Chromobacterium violaceum]KMO03799.1 hypothetical protein VL16_12490 [Chromobacterium violaceum]
MPHPQHSIKRRSLLRQAQSESEASRWTPSVTPHVRSGCSCPMRRALSTTNPRTHSHPSTSQEVVVEKILITKTDSLEELRRGMPRHFTRGS